VPCARLHAKHVLREWGITGDPAESVELAVSELVTNAIQASAALPDPVPAAVRLWLSRDVSHVLVEVGDAVAAPPAAERPEDPSEHGRGLMIVDAVSDERGTYELPAGGKVVWAKLAAPRAATP
jgi:anti-sigma regulatory factor (Ser/Thr protein kinase)